jgi:signal transduction histidine kinase
VSNVMRNAMQACERAGVVPQIRIDAHPDRDRKWIRVHVTDNGPGVDPSVRERIFQPFFTTRRDGTGLGLALVQKIIVTHNGRVSVSNDASGGAVFEMILPLAR